MVAAVAAAAVLAGCIPQPGFGTAAYVSAGSLKIVDLGSCRARTLVARGAFGPLTPSGGLFGLPADFLIAPDGRLAALKYGQNAYDQWTVDELLEHAKLVPA